MVAGGEADISENPNWKLEASHCLALEAIGHPSSAFFWSEQLIRPPRHRERKEILLLDERNHPRAHRLRDDVANHLWRQSATLSSCLGKG